MPAETAAEIEYRDMVERCLEIEITLAWEAAALPDPVLGRLEAEAHRLHETLHDQEPPLAVQ